MVSWLILAYSVVYSAYTENWRLGSADPPNLSADYYRR